MCIRKGAGRVLRLARSQHTSIFDMSLVCGVSALCSLVGTSRCAFPMLQNSHPTVRHFVKASPTFPLGGEPNKLQQSAQLGSTRCIYNYLSDLGLIKPQKTQHPPIRGWRANDTFLSVFSAPERHITHKQGGFSVSTHSWGVGTPYDL